MSNEDKLRAFAQDVMKMHGGDHMGNVRSTALLDLALKHGLLECKTMDAPCGDSCDCGSWSLPFPTKCNQETPLLTGEAR